MTPAPQRVPPLAPFEESPLRRLLVDRLALLTMGEVCSYAEMSRLIGCDIQREGRHVLTSAQKYLLRDRVVVSAVTNVGVKRASDVGIVDETEHRVKKITRASKRAARILSIADFEKLPPGDQLRYRVQEVKVAVVRQFSGARIEKRLVRAIEASVTPAQLRASVTKSLEQFA